MDPILATLAAKGLSLIGSAVLAKGKDFIEDKLGVSLEDSVSSEEGLLRLKALEMQHEEFLLQQAMESDKLYFEDTKSARALGVELSKSTSWLNANIMPLLAIGTISISSYLLWFSTETDVKMAAVSFITMVLGYFFGSSSGSKDKQEQLYKMKGESK